MINSLYFSLAMGMELPQPAPPEVAYAVLSIQIIQTTLGMSSCYITFNANRTQTSPTDYDLLLLPETHMGSRVIVTAVKDMMPSVLFDGIITRRELSYDDNVGGSTLTLALSDLCFAMDKEEKSRQFPALGDMEIIELLLAEYAEYGIIPEVMPVESATAPSDPLKHVPQQNATDYRFIQGLARKHGCYFYVQPGPTPGVNRAIWGPPSRAEGPQPPLRVNTHSSTNVMSANFTYDPAQSVRLSGSIFDEELNASVSVVTAASTRLPPLAAEPSLLSPVARTELFSDPRYGEITSEAVAQSITNMSSDAAMTSTITVDTTRYGSIVEKGGLIGVQGAGYAHDGLYWVQQVKHSITRSQYHQEITLIREGEGSTTPDVG